MSEITDPQSNESYVELRVHFTNELLEDGAGSGTTYLRPTHISRENLFNLTEEDLEGMEGAFGPRIEEDLSEVICYGGSTPID